MDVPEHWLQRQITLQEIETSNLVKGDRLGPEPVVFGFIHSIWLEFRDTYQPEDQVWEFCSDRESWANLIGRAGYVIFRDGKVVGFIETMMN